MQQRVNRGRFILLAVLTAATVLVGWWAQPENRLEVNENVFRVSELNEINRVELRSDSDLVRIQYDGGRWRVNDKYDADAGMIRVLFATLQQAQPKRLVSTALRDSIFAATETSGVKVSLYAGEELEMEFYAGGNQEKTQAFFADPATREVYVMTIPGYRVYVSGILALGVNGWRDKFVFGFNWQNFQTLEARFPKKPSENFVVAMEKDFFGIQGLQADTAKLTAFLDDVSLLTVEQYLSEPKLTDSLKGATPDMEILVTDIGSRTYRLRLFNPGEAREGYGLIQDSQTALFDRRKIQSLLKPKSFFREK